MYLPKIQLCSVFIQMPRRLYKPNIFGIDFYLKEVMTFIDCRDLVEEIQASPLLVLVMDWEWNELWSESGAGWNQRCYAIPHHGGALGSQWVSF